VKANGDADLDGDVDGEDFLAWQQQGGAAPAAAAASSVPEPTAIALAFCGALAALRRHS
jgi:hypothetical protein